MANKVDKQMGTKTTIRPLTANTKPQQICGNNPNRTLILVQNNGSGNVYITSRQNQPYTDGIIVAQSLSYSNDTTTDELWIQTASATQACIIEEDDA